jgi:hypothetical protein
MNDVRATPTGVRSFMHGKNEGPAPDKAPWTRGAFVSLWLIAFVLAGGVLALRWDSLIRELAGAPRSQVGVLR